MRFAIPTDAPGGLGSRRSAHFGHCDIFTIIDISAGNEVSNVGIIINEGHEAGGCMSPIQQLKDAGVEAIVVSGLGMRPMQGFNQAGIAVYYADSDTVTDVESVIDRILHNGLVKMHADQACRGSANCQH